MLRAAGRLLSRSTHCRRTNHQHLRLVKGSRVFPEELCRTFSNNGSKSDATIYMHHSDVGSVVHSAAVTLGLIHALSTLYPGVGYFRPVDKTSHGGFRSQLVREVYKLDDPLEDMYGLTQDEAYDLLEGDRMDDMLERILPAFERCRARHDVLVIEGSSLRDGANTAPLNASIAAALGTPALLLSDAEAAAKSHPKHKEVNGRWEDWEWEHEVINTVIDSGRIMTRNNVDIAGALIYKLPPVARGASRLKELFAESTAASLGGIPLVGAIPEDKQLESLQVEDVRRVLDAQILYGGQYQQDSSSPNLCSDIISTLVATTQLPDFLTLIPSHSDPTKGSLVLAHSSRPDILLGMIDLHETNLPMHVSAMVLTGGSPPSMEVDNLIRSRPTPCSLPVLLAPVNTNLACVELAKAEPKIEAASTRKIERAQVLFDQYVDMEALNSVLFKERPLRMNPKLFQYHLFQRARASNKHIVLPEGEEPRTIQAAGEVVRRGLCSLTLLGDPTKIQRLAKQLRVDLEGVDIVQPSASPRLEEYAHSLYEARKHKGLALDGARDHLTGDVNYFGTAMVGAGHADGMVSGAVHTTANTIRPALQIIKTNPATPLVSSAFFMCLPDRILVYGDCAINTNPTVEELATIAISSADTAAAFGIEPRVALLSYATGDSNTGPLIQKVVDATALAKQRRPNLAIEGPLQYDAAVNPETARTKMKGKETAVAGKATVLIFPDLNTGNNTYKAVQQSTGAVAMGPVLQGLRKPVNDLSRGCTVADIVTTIAITAIQAAADQTAAN